MDSGTIQATLEQKLRDQFAPQHLEVINESHLHAGHQPQFDGSGETHFRLKIVSEQFSGMSRVDRHRSVNSLINELMDQGLHAIAIEAKSPEEAV